MRGTLEKSAASGVEVKGGENAVQYLGMRNIGWIRTMNSEQ